MDKICLHGGRLYDPANQIDGEVRTVWIETGRIIAEPPDSVKSEFASIDVAGKLIFPGGVDMHSHLVGPKIGMARRMSPELFTSFSDDDRIDSRGQRLLPTLAEAAQRYLAMGYTTVMDAAITPLAARHVHHELEHLAGLDVGFFVLVGNHHYLLERSARGDVAGATRFLQWLLKRCGGFAPKLVNPGGVENWKAGRHGTTSDLDLPIVGFNTTPRRMIETLAAAANSAGLPHPVHLHCNNLGFPGNWQTTLETTRIIGGMQAHLAHVQFHSYGGDSPENITARVDELVDQLNANPQLSVDVGQVLFDKTISLTGDGPLGHFLGQLNRRKWFSGDTEIESGCGISPIEYRNQNLLNAVQWSAGLKWFLKVRNPWQIALSTDHPNGGSFQAYPQLMALLMSSERRREMLEQMPVALRERSDIASLNREYTLSEIAIITRAGPARLLGLEHKGHLGPSADADITVYTPDADIEKMFQMPSIVMKGGRFVIRDNEWQGPAEARTLCVGLNNSSDSAQDLVTDFEAEISHWFNKHYSLRVEHFGIVPKTDHFTRPRVMV